VPVVKFQSAYFEQFLWEGVEAYYELVQEAKELGLLVIGDVKRGDIGSTSQAYAAGHLGEIPFPQTEHVTTPDAITVNPFLGRIHSNRSSRLPGARKGFVCARPNQQSRLGGFSGREDERWPDVSEMLADKLAPLAASPGLIGQRGFSSIGAVVGATQPQTMVSIRKRLPQSIFLMPGYGTQARRER